VGEQRGPVPIAVSIGQASSPEDGRSPTDLIAAADHALYQVKRLRGPDGLIALDGASDSIVA
jgi:GGDEF domain-containing protein